MDIYKIISERTRVVENSAICRKYDIFGFYDPKINQLSMCTAKIKEFTNIKFNVNETFLHENVHLAQACKGRNNEFSAFNISQSTMILPVEKQKYFQKAISFNPNQKQIEQEAFWMENSPDKVKYVIKKYCL